MSSFKRCLIANRGEIAARIARSCRRLGIEPVAVHSSADRNSYHVRAIGKSVELGGAAASESYLDMAAVVRAAQLQECDLVHPGYGFLSENPAFARLLATEGITFAGPAPEALESCGDKAAAKNQALAAGLPVLGGSTELLDEISAIITAVETQGFPVMLKAAAGGGGRGMRVLQGPDDMQAVIESAMREATNAFGHPGLIVERWIERGRHIEIQIASDCHGNVVHLFERECSLQRRHQKVIEEAPAPNLSPELRAELTAAAVGFVESLEYQGVGTVEFLVADDEFWFLEMNPRLQVEHPVTEEVTGIDLVELQLRLAAGETMPFSQADLTCTGHAIEARLYAEDTAAGFLPSTGLVTELKLANDTLRIEQGIEAGDEITAHYDPMVAKLISSGSTRSEALQTLQAGLARCRVVGVESNLGFLELLLRQPEVAAGACWTRLIDERLPALQRGLETSRDHHAQLIDAIGGFFWLRARLDGQTETALQNPWSQWGSMTGWRFAADTPPLARTAALEIRNGDSPVAIVTFGALSQTGGQTTLTLQIGTEILKLDVTDLPGGRYRVGFKGVHYIVGVTLQSDQLQVDGLGPRQTRELSPYVTTSKQDDSAAALLRAPMMGQIMTLNFKIGDTVTLDETVAVLESMKMEIPLLAPHSGTVTALHCRAGGAIERGGLIAEIDPG